MLFSYDLKHIPENHLERRCCDSYSVWVPAQPESLAAVKIDSTILRPDFVKQAVNGI